MVAGHVQQVVAGVGHRQVVLLGRGGLDDDAQALHAVDGDAVAAGQEHCGGGWGGGVKIRYENTGRMNYR